MRFGSRSGRCSLHESSKPTSVTWTTCSRAEIVYTLFGEANFLAEAVSEVALKPTQRADVGRHLDRMREIEEAFRVLPRFELPAAVSRSGCSRRLTEGASAARDLRDAPMFRHRVGQRHGNLIQVWPSIAQPEREPGTLPFLGS